MGKIKVAISAKENNLEGEIGDVFGRSPYFVIAEIENGEMKKTEIIENKNANQTGGAGISAAQLMAEKNVNAVITKNVGPRALDVLKQFNIGIYHGEGMIEEVLQKFMDGKLEKTN
jgi:predicted Fe-Mo cluster-binding NifX family protein